MHRESLADDVERLFAQSIDNQAEVQTNPVTGGRWIRGLDSVKSQKQTALRALVAAAQYAASAPPEVPILPLTYRDRESLKRDFGVGYIVALYARSLACRDYRTAGHPNFHDYACGLLATNFGARVLAASPHLADRYPPKWLPELDESGYFNG